MSKLQTEVHKEFPDKNKLVQWRGGGYDGCIWEPSTGFFDDKGQWVPVISRGAGKRDTLEEFNAKRKSETQYWRAAKGGKAADIVYPITKEGLLEFQLNIREDYFMETLRKLEDSGYPVYWKCSCCDAVQEGLDSFYGFASYRGDGGVGIIHSDPICVDCAERTQCCNCGERCGTQELVSVSGDLWCPDCLKVVVEAKATPEEHKLLETLESDLKRFQEQTLQYCELMPNIKTDIWAQYRKACEALETERENILYAVVTRG